MKKLAIRTVLFLIPFTMIVGLTTGLMIRPMIDQLIHDRAADQTDDDHDDHNDGEMEEEAEHIALTRQAFQNLKLKVEAVALSDYTQTIRMPGEVTESPGLSLQKVAAPVSGQITRLFTYPGVSVTEGMPLCEIQIVDNHLEDAQLRLLELLTKQEIIDAELTRLAPLVSTGSVAGRKHLEWEYQKKEVDSSLARTKQELALRGLSEDEIEQIVRTRKVVSTHIVNAPKGVAASLQTDGGQSMVRPVFWMKELPDQTDLTVEELLVESGQNVTRGEVICTLASYGLLSVRGYAFENEIDIVSRLAAEERAVAVEFGIGKHTDIRSGLNIQYVDCNVDPSTQSFQFYVPLPNKVVAESTDPLGRRFRTWQYKVGQRVHLLVPDRVAQEQIVVPRDALVREGPDAYVFREVVDMPEETVPHASELTEASDEHAYMELEPVPVTVVHQDRAYAVIAPNEAIDVGDHIAMNSGYQLFLALKSQQSTHAGGHDHHH